MFAHGRNLDVLTQAQTIETFQPLRDDLERLSRALYAVELVDRATEVRAENFAIYRLLLDTLRRLVEADDLDTCVRFFEFGLLGQLGYGPELRECIACRQLLREEANVWAPGLGGVACPRCRPEDEVVRPLSLNALKLLRLMERGRFDDIARVRVSGDLARELELHLRDAVHFALDRDLRSASFIEVLRRGRAGATIRRPEARNHEPV